MVYCDESVVIIFFVITDKLPWLRLFNKNITVLMFLLVTDPYNKTRTPKPYCFKLNALYSLFLSTLGNMLSIKNFEKFIGINPFLSLVASGNSPSRTDESRFCDTLVEFSLIACAMSIVCIIFLFFNRLIPFSLISSGLDVTSLLDA